MAVTFNQIKKYYYANFNGKRYTYSVNKYGPLAEEIANESFKKKKKIYNLIEKHEDYAVIKIIKH